jgi:Eukaryotic translation initiation factor 4G1
MPVHDLPTRNDVSAPRFDEDNPRGLATYFEELEHLFARHRVSDATHRKRSAVRYVSVNVRELWKCAVTWSDPARSYEDFKAEVYAFYPEVTDAVRYTTGDLDALVNERAQREIQSVEDLDTFYQKFIVISTFLVKRNRLSTLEQARWFLSAFSGDQAECLRQLLELKYPDAQIGTIPHLRDIFQAVQFVLQWELDPAVATTATAPEAPRQLGERNAEPTAHVATGAASAMVLCTSTSSPGTPKQSNVVPPILHHPHTSAPRPPPSVTSTLPTPSASSRSTSPSVNAGAVDDKEIPIENASGKDAGLEVLKCAPPTAIPPVPSSASVQTDTKQLPIRVESQEEKDSRLVEEGAKEGEGKEENKASEAVAKTDEDAVSLLIEKTSHKAKKEVQERIAQEEKELKEAEERVAREEAERKEGEERAAREERERELLRLEEAHTQREVEEKAEREWAEQERLRKLQEDDDARAREEAERRRNAEEEAVKIANATDTSHVLADEGFDAKLGSLPEEGDIEDDLSQLAAPTPEESAPNSGNVPTPSLPNIPAELPAKPSESLRIDTALPSLELTRKRPGPLNLQTTINTNTIPPLPSALATARFIEDINRISYPEGVKGPKAELNVNTEKGKFRYVRRMSHGAFVFQHISLVGMIATSYYSS